MPEPQPQRFTVPPSAAGQTLIDFLGRSLNLSRRQTKALIDTRSVWVDDRRVWMARHPLRAGNRIEITSGGAAAMPRAPIEVLYRDDHYIIADKPPGLLADGPHSVESRLRRRLALPGLSAVHRLDRDTSGCLLLAVDRESFEKMIPLFRARAVRKTYRVLVSGRLPSRTQTLKRPVGGRQAITHLRPLDANRRASHVEVTIETGRTHQIRRHLVSIGHPVIGDRHYATRLPSSDPARHTGRQMLHACGLEFVQPITGRTVRARSPLPRDFRAALKRLNLT